MVLDHRFAVGDVALAAIVLWVGAAVALVLLLDVDLDLAPLLLLLLLLGLVHLLHG